MHHFYVHKCFFIHHFLQKGLSPSTHHLHLSVELICLYIYIYIYILGGYQLFSFFLFIFIFYFKNILDFFFVRI